MSTIRTRFAPSPTGFVHVGSLRTALYNFLFARKHGGDFLVRVEDTDQSRKVEGAVENLIKSLEWAGITYDEGPFKDGEYGPYVQSERLELYQKYAHQLVKEGKAYYCTCTPERLDQMRQRQMAAKQPPMYDRHCRNLNIQLTEGQPYVIRMKVPLDGEITFHDIVRGNVSFSYRTVDDQVILKSDGFPTYHLAVVVDDHLMKITHIIRGEEWLSSVPKHILLYQFLGWDVPQMAHLPLLLNPDRSKLSKRQGDVAVEDYRDKGYLPEALVNFVAFLGWNPGDEREIFTMDELIKEFSLERVGKSGAVFNVDKLRWFNEQHLRRKTNEELLALLKPIMRERGLENVSDEYLLKVIDLMKERVVFMHDFADSCRYFYEDPKEFDGKAFGKCWTPQTAQLLKSFAMRCSTLPDFDAATVEKELRHEAADAGVGAAKIIHPLRLAVSGVGVGASLFHMLELLGKETTIRRINYAVETLD